MPCTLHLMAQSLTLQTSVYAMSPTKWSSGTAQVRVCSTEPLKCTIQQWSIWTNCTQLHKWGNITQDCRKLEETVFWAGLARSLCELQLTSWLWSLAPNSAENIPSAAEDNAPQVFASGLYSRTLCTWWKSDKYRSFSLSIIANLVLGRGECHSIFLRCGMAPITALLTDCSFCSSPLP